MGIVNWLDPHVDKYILTTAGEHKVLEVKKHWVASAWPGVRAGVAFVILVSAFAFTGAVFWVIFLLGLVIGVQALYRIIEEYRDRFVITNQRVFRVHGVLCHRTRQRAITEDFGHHCQQARHRPVAELWEFRLRVRGSSPRPERDHLRKRHRSA